MESYRLKPDEKRKYQFKDHENESEIADKWVELLNKVNELDITLSEENLYAKIGAGLHM